MDEKELENLAEQCNLYDTSDNIAVIQKISALEESYDTPTMIVIYNYFLGVTKSPDVVMFLIKCLDRYRDPTSLNALLDVLLLRNIETKDNSEKETPFQLQSHKMLSISYKTKNPDRSLGTHNFL